MRGLLVSPISKDFEENQGILRKFEYQRSALERLLGDVDAVCNGLSGPVLNGETFGSYSKRGRGFNSLNHYVFFYDHLKKLCKEKRYDFVYVRYPFALPSFVSWLRSLKTFNLACCVIIEVPTYPYRQEMKTPKQRILLALDDFGKGRLKHHADAVVTFFGQDEIFGIRCIKSGNGIDIDRFPVRQPPNNNAEISIITVANIADWHGIDRAIEGLAQASPQTRSRISLNIVGRGPAEERLRSLLQSRSLESSVHFHGIQMGTALDELFARNDIALGSLGMHRLGLERSSSLKVREYCARGIPFVVASEDPDFPPDWPYALSFPADESPIDFDAIVSFFDTVKRAHPNFASEMRAYATENLTWVAKLSEVAEMVRSHSQARAR